MAVPFFLLLAGCGGYYYVRVPSPKLRMLPPETLLALSDLHIVVLTKKGARKIRLKKLLKDLAETENYYLNSLKFSRMLARNFKMRGIRNVTYVAIEKGKFSPFFFAKKLFPKGILLINFSAPRVLIKKTEKEVEIYDRNKKKREKRKTPIWVYSLKVRANCKLISYPGKQVLNTFEADMRHVQEFPDGKRNPGHWFEKNQNKILNLAVKKVIGAFFRGDEFASRRIFYEKGDKESEKAFELAKEKNWQKAAVIWQKRTEEKTNWKDYANLGVFWERKGRYDKASEYYLAAKDRSEGDKKAASVDWDKIMAEVEFSEKLGLAKKGEYMHFFKGRVAVLPFSNETVSMAAPEIIRRKIYENLKKSGYGVQPMEETDKILRKKGYTDGGQIKRLSRRKLAEWLGAEKLVYGNISDFSNIMAGIYNKRKVSGNVVFWDKREGEIFSVEKSVVRAKTEKKLVGGFMQQMARSWWEKIKKKPLGFETGIFIRAIAGYFPGRI